MNDSHNTTPKSHTHDFNLLPALSESLEKTLLQQYYSLAIIDKACDQFEFAWTSNAGLSIEALLTAYDHLDQTDLLRSLLDLELDLRSCRGDQFNQSEYELRFPLDVETIRKVFRDRMYRDCRGTTIGSYSLMHKLGTGGMGEVFLATHNKMKRKVALKFLTPDQYTDQEKVQRFIVEAQAAARLDHRNVVHVYDFDPWDLYLVMEYVQGQNLDFLVRQSGPLEYRRAASYALQATAGLAHAHAMGVVHRDLKPANCIVDGNDNLKLLDLGLSLVDDARTIEYGVLGTVDFMAPEQALDSAGVDARADIYSLGCTFYFLLTGRPPFPKGSAAERLLMHQTAQPAPIRQFRPDVPAPLSDVCVKMMCKKPSERFQSAKEVTSCLADWLASEQSTTR